MRWVDPRVVLAGTVWLLVVLVVCGRGAIEPRKHSLYPTYAAAGSDWLAGTSLYYHGPRPSYFDQYRYSPFVAVILVPFHLLPEWLGSLSWRLLNVAVFLAGLEWWIRKAVPVAFTMRHQAYVFLAAVPLSLSSLNNSQPNALVIGLLLIAVAAVVEERWWLAAAGVALATALKIYPLAVGLLLAVVYPKRFAPRLLLALACVAGLPFLFQHDDYVAARYREWYQLLGEDDRKFWPLHMTYRDLWLLFRVCHVSLSPRAYIIVQLAVAAGCAVLCLAGRWRGWGPRQLTCTALILGSLWMTLCGPATESCTYILLAPALAYALVASTTGRWPMGVRGLCAASFLLFLACVLAGLFRDTSSFHALGLHPLAALLLGVGYVVMIVRELRQTSAASGQDGYPQPPHVSRAGMMKRWRNSFNHSPAEHG
jgi:hypothetical protein